MLGAEDTGARSVLVCRAPHPPIGIQHSECPSSTNGAWTLCRTHRENSQWVTGRTKQVTISQPPRPCIPLGQSWLWMQEEGDAFSNADNTGAIPFFLAPGTCLHQPITRAAEDAGDGDGGMGQPLCLSCLPFRPSLRIGESAVEKVLVLSARQAEK